MKHPIGFRSGTGTENTPAGKITAQDNHAVPRRSVVQVHFPTRRTTLPYYNDHFDLHCGDLVFVDGSFEGLRGRVVDVAYSFKIRLSDYKRVIAVADTRVSGEFFLAGSHFVSFDRDAIPFEKAITWFRAPLKPDEEFASGYDGSSFELDHLGGMGIGASAADRGENYYRDNKVVYLSVDAEGIGRAIVEGSEPYTVEFRCEGRRICDLTCSCFCSYPCKHEFAAMLQLRETLAFITKHYSAQYEECGYFAAMSKPVFMNFAVDSKETGSFKL